MDAREELISELESILGLVPAQTRLLLNVLTHPDLIEHTKAFIRSRDVNTTCTKYESPWSCLKEAEAKFENVKYGWLGGGGEMELDWICESCRKRMMEE